MKNGKTKILTLMLASALGLVSFGGAAISSAFVKADETETTSTALSYSASEVFGTSSATLNSEGEYVAMQFSNGGKVTLKQRDLALKWYDKVGDKVEAQYLNMTFALDENFEKISIVLESSSATATKDKMTTNTLTFSRNGGTVTAKVNDSETGVEFTDTSLIKVSLGESDEYGAFKVYVNGNECGLFENIGDNFAEYASSSQTTPIQPLAFKAVVPEDDNAETAVKSVLTLMELNGQSFKLSEDDKIVDNAKPVLCVNDEINTFSLGTTFSVNYEAVDVLDKSVTATEKYYQYDPDDTAVTDENYKEITSDSYFLYTPYGADGKYVYDTEYNGVKGREFVSVKITIPDDSWKDTEAAVYELVWYANQKATFGDIDYIIIDENENAPSYNYVAMSEETYEKAVEDYQTAVTASAEGLEAGSSTEFYLPSLEKLIGDDEGYKNLKFTISYNSSVSTSETPTNNTGRSSSNLKFTVSKAATYEFKVFAEDKAGNKMKALDENGELVEVTTDNLWLLDSIPSFQFTVASPSLKIEDPSTASGRTDIVTLNNTYDDFDVDVVGDSASNTKVTSVLYRIDFTAYNALRPADSVSEPDLSKIEYEAIATKAKALGIASTDVSKFFLQVYAELLAEEIEGITAQDLIDGGLFVEIEEFNSAIDEEEHPEAWAVNNKYHWSADAQSFTAAEEGTYLMLVVYEDKDVSSLKAGAYKVITVASANDKLPGESDWLKNNVVSVVLFGIAALMLVLIIILLLIKPTDETLEDVDAAVKAKKDKKDKKN